MFGPQIDEDDHLFEIDRFYVLEVVLDDRGAVTALNVVPKYWFEDRHPEWTKSDDFRELTQQEYEALLARLEEIRPKGRLVCTDSFAIVTNLVAPIRAVHEKAVLVTGWVSDVRRGDDAPALVRYIEIDYTAEGIERRRKGGCL